MEYKDFENKPLLGHTKVDYYECLAKLILEKLFLNEFGSLEILDKPDLQDDKNSIGVEVTRAIDKEQEKKESLYAKIESRKRQNGDGTIEKINNSYKSRSVYVNGEEIREPNRYNDGILVGIPDSDDFNRIFERFSDKIKKLNDDGYKKYIKNYLFVYSDILANQQMINQAISKMNTIQSKYKLWFQKVFVNVPHYIYILNLESKKGESMDIKSVQVELAERARNMVIQGEISKSIESLD